MELSVLNIKGEDTGRKVTLNDAIFGIEPNDHAIYLDVKQYLANQRQGTHKSKERSEVSGSTRKLIRQKGGGGARRGARRRRRRLMVVFPRSGQLLDAAAAHRHLLQGEHRMLHRRGEVERLPEHAERSEHPVHLLRGVQRHRRQGEHHLRRPAERRHPYQQAPQRTHHGDGVAWRQAGDHPQRHRGSDVGRWQGSDQSA